MEFGNFFQVPVNYFAVLLCGISSMIIGYLWYGPFFGKRWEKLVGFTAEKKANAKKEMSQKYTLMFVLSLITAYILFHFIWYAAPGSYTLFIAVKTAVWAWIGFIAAVSLSKFIFSPEKTSITLYYIETGYYLVSLIVMALIFYILK